MIVACGEDDEPMSPPTGRGEDVPGTSSRLSAVPNQGIREVVRLSQTAALITFSEFPVGTEITDQYKDEGIIFAGSNPFITTDADNPTSPVLSGTPLFEGAITGTFVVPGTTTPTTVESFSLDAGYFDEVGTTELRWFDSNGVLIGSRTNTTFGIETFTVNRAWHHELEYFKLSQASQPAMQLTMFNSRYSLTLTVLIFPGSVGRALSACGIFGISRIPFRSRDRIRARHLSTVGGSYQKETHMELTNGPI